MPLSEQSDRVVLTGNCGAEDAEALQTWLVANPRGVVDLEACEHLHTALVQVLVASGRSFLMPSSPELASILAAVQPADP